MGRAVPFPAYNDAAATPAADQRGRHPVILLVEDDVLIRFLVAEELRCQGNVVLEAANAAEALALLGSGVHVELLLTDVRMPGPVDGAALARRVRMEHPQVKVVVVSGHLRESELGVEVHGFFAKPFDIPRLGRHIKMLLDGQGARLTQFGVVAKA